jgi:flagellar FliL protein
MRLIVLIWRSLPAGAHSFGPRKITGIAVATALPEYGIDRQFDNGEGTVAAKDEQKETAEQKPSGGSKKKWFLIGGILVTAISIGAAVFFFMHGRGEGEEGEEGEGENTHAAAATKKVHAIYPMEPLIVNIHDSAELRYLKIKLDFEINGPETKAEIDPFLPQMQDAILVLLSGKQMAEITTTEGKNRLKEEIMASVGKIVPPKKITRVYFTDFVVQ